MEQYPDLPSDWSIETIESLMTKVKAGGTPKRGTDGYWSGDIPFVKIEDITRSGGFVQATAQSISKDGLESSSAWVVPTESVLLTMYGTIGVPAMLLQPMATNQAIIALLPSDRVDRNYLYFALKRWGPEMERLNVQSTQKNISARIVRAFEIHVPPLPEQRAIAHVLRTVQQARDTTELVIESAKELKRSLMRHLFTYGPVPLGEIGDVDLVDNAHLGPLPRSWSVKSIAAVTTKLKAGGTPKRSSVEFWGGEIPFVKIDDITSSNGVLEGSSETITRAGLEGSAAWIVPENSVLLTMYATIGVSAINAIPVATNQAIIALVVREGMSHSYLRYALELHGPGMARLNVQSTQKNISKRIVESYPIPVPDLANQQAMARSIDAIESTIQADEQSRLALDALFSSLLSELMSGRMRVPESMWEPAA